MRYCCKEKPADTSHDVHPECAADDSRSWAMRRVSGPRRGAIYNRNSIEIFSTRRSDSAASSQHDPAAVEALNYIHASDAGKNTAGANVE